MNRRNVLSRGLGRILRRRHADHADPSRLIEAPSVSNAPSSEGRQHAAPTYAIDAPTIDEVFIADETLAHLSDPERQALLGRVWDRFAARGWEMASHGPLEMAARLRSVETIRRLSYLLGRGGDLSKDLERRINAAWEWRDWTRRHGGVFSAPTPWPVRELPVEKSRSSREEDPACSEQQ